jgi:hypothetical protein
MAIRELASGPKITDTVEYEGGLYPLTRLKGYWGVLREGTLIPLSLNALVREGNKWVYHRDKDTSPNRPKAMSNWEVRIAYRQYDKTFRVSADTDASALRKALGMCGRETGLQIPLIQYMMKQSNFTPKPERL